MVTALLLLNGGFTIESLVPILIKLVIAGLIVYVLFWAIGKIGLPEPFGKVLLALVVLVVVIYLITLLASLG